MHRLLRYFDCRCSTDDKISLWATAQLFEDPAFHNWVGSRATFGQAGRIEEGMGEVTFFISDASMLITKSVLMIVADRRRRETVGPGVLLHLSSLPRCSCAIHASNA